jgi:hypothetical protein
VYSVLSSPTVYRLNLTICTKCSGERSRNITAEWMFWDRWNAQYVVTTSKEHNSTRDELRKWYAWDGMEEEAKTRKTADTTASEG